MQNGSLTPVLTVIIIIYIYGRREYDDIRNNTKFELCIYICIYIIYIIFPTYLYSYTITTLYHSVVSENLFAFSMFDCL